MAETADGTDDVHRLRDIVVEEVSLVDRAANKRRFLVVKRSAEMQDGEDQEFDESVDGAGGGEAPDEDVVKAKKKPSEAADDEVDQEKRAKPPSEEELDKAGRGKSTAEGDEVDGSKGDGAPAKGSSDKKERRAKALSLPASLKDALLAGLTDALEQLMAIANAVREAEPAEGDASVPQDVNDGMAAVSALLDGFCQGAPEAKKKASVEKAGARMAKDRLDRFQKALSLLADILKELTDAKILAGEPTAGSAQKTVRKQEPTTPPASVPGMAELVSGVSELTRVVKRQEEELGRIRQVRGVSNAIQVDGTGRRPEQADVSWPLDMNRPINREQVKKEVSFFDE